MAYCQRNRGLILMGNDPPAIPMAARESEGLSTLAASARLYSNTSNDAVQPCGRQDQAWDKTPFHLERSVAGQSVGSRVVLPPANRCLAPCLSLPCHPLSAWTAGAAGLGPVSNAGDRRLQTSGRVS